MNNKQSVDDQLKQALARYRNFLIPVSVIFVSALLFIEIIIPQFQTWLANQQQAVEAKQRLETMAKNLQLLTALDEQSLDSNLNLVSSALPGNQDLYGIVTAINRAGIQSQVSVGDYTFTGTTASSATPDQQSLSINLVVVGNIDSVTKFIAEVKHQLPLADISTVKISGQGAGSSITVLFYYKDFPHLAFNNSDLIQGLSAKDNDILSKLSNYEQNAADENDVIVPTN